MPHDGEVVGGKSTDQTQGLAPALLVLRRRVFPSMATTVSLSSVGTNWLTQRRNAASNSCGSRAANTRPKVSCAGIPCSSTRKPRSQSIRSLAHASMSENSSALHRTEHTATVSKNREEMLQPRMRPSSQQRRNPRSHISEKCQDPKRNAPGEAGRIKRHFKFSTLRGHNDSPVLSAYSTVTDFARFRGLSTSVPLTSAAW